jgi:hypothetical protein
VIWGTIALLSLSYYIQRYTRPPSRIPQFSVSPVNGVDISGDSNFITIRVDDRVETVPRNQLQNSELLKEAASRSANATTIIPSTPQVRWNRVLWKWIPLNLFMAWLLFRVLKDDNEGAGPWLRL